MYDALRKQAQHEGQGASPGGGVSYIVRRAARYWLSKNGHRAEELDMDDESYRNRAETASDGVPGTRKDIEEETPGVAG